MKSHEMEAKENECQASSPHPEASLTANEKRQLIQSLVNSMQANGEMDYLLIKDIEQQYPCPSINHSDCISNTTSMPAPTLPSKPKRAKTSNNIYPS